MNTDPRLRETFLLKEDLDDESFKVELDKAWQKLCEDRYFRTRLQDKLQSAGITCDSLEKFRRGKYLACERLIPADATASYDPLATTIIVAVTPILVQEAGDLTREILFDIWKDMIKPYILERLGNRIQPISLKDKANELDN